jgi:ADP-ribosyl-[dinitrogen reductase] hydrolase
MTLFTLEGLIRASVRGRTKGNCYPPGVVHHAYLRWLHTQGVPFGEALARYGAGDREGWLIGVQELHHRRAPGMTCLSALKQTSPRDSDQGVVGAPINDSKGCGGVMRMAPVGFLPGSREQSFKFGCDFAALTHGHPSGYLPAGVLAAMVRGVMDDESLPAALDAAAAMLRECPGHEETSRAIELSRSGLPTPAALEGLGGAWVGEEALAIGLCCALAAPDLEAGVVAAVNHSGDSDSTGSIAADAALEFGPEPPSDEWGGATAEWFERYPGW